MKEKVKEIIYVDHTLRPCSKGTEGARIARYKPEFELYVVDTPKDDLTEEKKWL